MRSCIARFLSFALAVVPAAVLAKPEQIRGVSSPIFHYYLQASSQDRTFPLIFYFPSSYFPPEFEEHKRQREEKQTAGQHDEKI